MFNGLRLEATISVAITSQRLMPPSNKMDQRTFPKHALAASYASVRHVTQRDLSAICSSSATAMKSRGEVDALCERVYFFHVNEFTVLERIVSRTAFIQKLHQVLESNFCSSSSSVGSEMSSRQSPSLILPCQGDKPCSKSN